MCDSRRRLSDPSWRLGLLQDDIVEVFFTFYLHRAEVTAIVVRNAMPFDRAPDQGCSTDIARRRNIYAGNHRQAFPPNTRLQFAPSNICCDRYITPWYGVCSYATVILPLPYGRISATNPPK